MSDQAPSNPQVKKLVPRRLIFGATTTQPNLEDLAQITKEERQRQMEKWNFDFVNEIPLEGDWEWERVAPPKVQPTQTSENETREEWRHAWSAILFNLVLVKLFSDVLFISNLL